MSGLISIGKILNFHGIKGEVKLGYTKGKEEQLKKFNEENWWEWGRKIRYISGEKIYVNMRPRPVQYNRLSNPSRCHFG